MNPSEVWEKVDSSWQLIVNGVNFKLQALQVDFDSKKQGIPESPESLWESDSKVLSRELQASGLPLFACQEEP